MLRLTVTHGAAFARVMTVFDDDGSVPASFDGTEVLRSDFWDGQDQTVLFNPTVTWNDFTTGKFSYSFTNAQSALTEPNGTYRVQVFALRVGTEYCIADFLQSVSPSVGAATQAITCYNTLQDMLTIAPWITGTQDVDTDQEGFYSQRLKARLWFDDIVLNHAQNNFIGIYGVHSQSAFAFGYVGGFRQQLGWNPIIKGYLDANKLMVRPSIIRACAHYAVGQVGIAQVSSNMSLAKLGQWHLAKADRMISGITAEIDIDGDGTANFSCVLSTIATLLG